MLPLTLHRALLALALCHATGLAAAAGAPATRTSVALFQQERAACLRGDTPQTRETCLREAGAALQEARHGSMGSTPTYAANALRRCEPLPERDREACIARIHGQGSVSGSVGGGGLYRELVTTEAASPARPQPRP